jgi:hypothetical protein
MKMSRWSIAAVALWAGACASGAREATAPAGPAWGAPAREWILVERPAGRVLEPAGDGAVWEDAKVLVWEPRAAGGASPLDRAVREIAPGLTLEVPEEVRRGEIFRARARLDASAPRMHLRLLDSAEYEILGEPSAEIAPGGSAQFLLRSWATGRIRIRVVAERPPE